METAQERLQNQHTMVTKVSQGSIWPSILLRDQACSGPSVICRLLVSHGGCSGRSELDPDLGWNLTRMDLDQAGPALWDGSTSGVALQPHRTTLKAPSKMMSSVGGVRSPLSF